MTPELRLVVAAGVAMLLAIGCAPSPDSASARETPVLGLVEVNPDGLTTGATMAAPGESAYEGFGAATSGGAGGEVFVVSTLALTGPGSLQSAIYDRTYVNGELVPRRVTFSVGGDIFLVNELEIAEGLLTIDGWTAPPPGITLRKGALKGTITLRNVSDVIINHLRFVGNNNPDGQDNLSLRGARRVILDHVTSTSADDGAIDIAWNGNEDITVSWCLIHDNAKAMIISYGPNARISLHRNVWARNTERTPQIRYENNVVDFVNNIVFDWGAGQWGYGVRVRKIEAGAGYGNGSSDVNLVANAFIPGSTVAANGLIFADNAGTSDDGGPPGTYAQGVTWTAAQGSKIGKVYVAGNLLPGQNKDHYSSVSAPLPIPPQAQVTADPAATLHYSVLPEVGMLYRTAAEQALLDAIDAAMGG